MKHLKLYERFYTKEEIDGLEKIIPDLKETFQDLEDKSYEIKITNGLSRFQTSNGWKIPDLDVRIYPPKFSNHDKNIFRLADIKENLLFTISYANDELGLKLNYLTISFAKKYIDKLYEDIELVPDDIDIFNITISFILA